MRPHGFTLIELLVSLAVVSLIGVMTFTGLSTTLNFNQLVLSRSDTTNNLILLDETLRRDFQHSLNRLSRDERGDRLKHSFYGSVPNDQGYFLTFSAHFDNQKSMDKGSIRLVQYLLVNNKLERKEYSYADRTIDTPSSKQVLLNNVKDISLKFILEERWLDEWPFMDWTENNGLPKMIEISIDTESLGTVTRRYLLPEGAY